MVTASPQRELSAGGGLLEDHGTRLGLAGTLDDDDLEAGVLKYLLGVDPVAAPYGRDCGVSPWLTVSATVPPSAILWPAGGRCANTEFSGNSVLT